METTHSAMRRTPNQKRSRDRVERILDAATGLIADHGTDGLRMSHLAKAAGISIGSLYQYFPDKRAITHTLAERYGEAGRHCIEEELAGVTSPETLVESFGRLIDIYYEIFLAEPVMRDIWSGAFADAELREVELADSRVNAAILVRALRAAGASADESTLAAGAFLVMHLGETTMHLAISLEREEGDRVVATYQRMALLTLMDLLD